MSFIAAILILVRSLLFNNQYRPHDSFLEHGRGGRLHNVRQPPQLAQACRLLLCGPGPGKVIAIARPSTPITSGNFGFEGNLKKHTVQSVIIYIYFAENQFELVHS